MMKNSIKHYRIIGLAILCSNIQARNPHDLVDISTINKNIVLDMRYASENNFTKKKIYTSARCFLRTSVAHKLDAVQKELEKKGLGLKIWDGYRPLSAQRIMWNLIHDSRYVENPAKGSRHNRGCAVDVTLVTKKGKELLMPTGFDDFSERAHTNYMKLPRQAIKNRQLLQGIMIKHGFLSMRFEWWHFDEANWQQCPILDIDIEKLT
ncbi:MAG: D-alanyl-D-alanine dipeptidase [Candidatus Dependentiae bacterium]|nr:D-alanyl-D-alanine dipeptidase [Candidatus Dependentiae bacterium]